MLEAARVAGIGTVEGETKTAVLREVVWGDVLGKGWRNGAFVRVFYLFEFAGKFSLTLLVRTTPFLLPQFTI